ncbi:MAG: hypothetical protein KIG30_00100 [Eubacteriales bacterium]|nr:hypothetical protein [Eubacteriales bacterium]
MRYQVITWTRGEGHDERREFSTLSQARAAARIYRREGDGVGIYDFRLGVIRETIGDFQLI